MLDPVSEFNPWMISGRRLGPSSLRDFFLADSISWWVMANAVFRLRQPLVLVARCRKVGPVLSIGFVVLM